MRISIWIVTPRNFGRLLQTCSLSVSSWLLIKQRERGRPCLPLSTLPIQRAECCPRPELGFLKLKPMSPLKCLWFTTIGLLPSSDLSFHKETTEHVKIKKDSVFLNLFFFFNKIEEPGNRSKRDSWTKGRKDSCQTLRLVYCSAGKYSYL